MKVADHLNREMEPADFSRSIFDHPFYRPLLAAGEIPGEEKIPMDLLRAMAILIGRYTEQYVDPMECRGVAALVVLGMCQRREETYIEYFARRMKERNARWKIVHESR